MKQLDNSKENAFIKLYLFHVYSELKILTYGIVFRYQNINFHGA